MADEHNGPAPRHEDGHDHGDDVELIEAGTTPAAAVAPKQGPFQTWRTYAPAIISLVLLLIGIALDYFNVSTGLDLID